MEKILRMILFLFVIMFLSIINVFADEINSISEIELENMYYYKKNKRTGTGPHEIAKMYKDKNGNYLYCLNPLNCDISESENYAINNELLSKEDIDYINKIAYFGFGYKDDEVDHSSLFWYTFIQTLIWKRIDPSYDYYYNTLPTSTISNSTYQSYLLELDGLITNFEKEIKFTKSLETYTYRKTEFIDKNNRLSKYKIVDNNNLDVSIDNDSLIVDTYSSSGTFNVLLKDKNYENKLDAIVLSNNSSSFIMPVPPILDDINLSILVRECTYTFKISINLFEKAYYDDGLKIISSNPQLDGVLFRIIANGDITDGHGNVLIHDKELVHEFNVSKDGNTFTMIPGKYTITMVDKIPSYTMYKNNFTINTTSGSNANLPKILTFIMNEVRFEQKDKTYKVMPNIEIGLYAKEDIYNYLGEIYAKKDTLINKYITDESGIFADSAMYLNEGSYYFKILSEIEDYDTNKVFEFDYSGVDYNNSLYTVDYLDMSIDLKRKNLSITNIDLTTKNNITGITYQILNKDKEVVETLYSADSNISTYLIPDEYYIKELYPKKGYKSDNIIYYCDLLNNDSYNLSIYNERIEDIILPDEDIKETEDHVNSELNESSTDEIDSDNNNELEKEESIDGNESESNSDLVTNYEEIIKPIDKEVDDNTYFVPKTVKYDVLIYIPILILSLILKILWKKRLQLLF